MPRRETGRVVAESRYDPRCDTIGALDGRLVALVRSGTPLRRALSAAALSREVRDIDVGALESGGAEDDDEARDREVLRVRVPPRVKTKWGDVKRQNLTAAPHGGDIDATAPAATQGQDSPQEKGKEPLLPVPLPGTQQQLPAGHPPVAGQTK